MNQEATPEIELNPDDYELEVVKYRKDPRTRTSLADRALARAGNEDTWSKSDLRKIKWMRRWRQLKSLPRTLLGSLRIGNAPKPPFSD